LQITASGVSGRGEASPLPGYSIDDLDACVAELDGCWRKLGGLDLDAPARDLLRDAVGRAGVHAPAAVFAIESAVLDLVARLRAEPAWRLLRGDGDAGRVPLSALVDGESPAALGTAAEAAVARGIHVLKVKVGGPDCVRRDPERLAAIRAHVGEDVTLRLDANQSLRADNFRAVAEALLPFRPVLLEEPVPTADIASIVESLIPLAMDESLLEAGWRDRLTAAAARRTCTAVVLKPMALGGMLRCLQLAELAAELGVGTYVTHLVDGPIASAAAACLALALPGPVLPCGLDAHGRLSGDLVAIGPSHVEPFTSPGLGTEARL
jgi:L-alanine-DL-glutamate epimerase-like enolase superfamily enzyme